MTLRDSGRSCLRRHPVGGFKKVGDYQNRENLFRRSMRRGAMRIIDQCRFAVAAEVRLAR